MEQTLSNNAIKDLRIALAQSYGKDWEASLTDEEVTEIGDLLLNILAESLKIKIASPELLTPLCR